MFRASPSLEEQALFSASSLHKVPVLLGKHQLSAESASPSWEAPAILWKHQSCCGSASSVQEAPALLTLSTPQQCKSFAPVAAGVKLSRVSLPFCVSQALCLDSVLREIAAWDTEALSSARPLQQQQEQSQPANQPASLPFAATEPASQPASPSFAATEPAS